MGSAPLSPYKHSGSEKMERVYETLSYSGSEIESLANNFLDVIDKLRGKVEDEIWF